VNHIGPITRTVVDAALLLQHMAGYDERESTSSRAPASDYVKAARLSCRRFRVGLPRSVFYENLDVDIERAMAEAVRVIGQLVAEVRNVQLPKLTTVSTALAEVAALHGARFEKTPEAFHPAIRVNLARAVRISAAEYIRNRRELDQLRLNTDALFPDVNLLVTPTVEQNPLPIAEVLQKEPWGSNRNAGPFNKYGLPAISVPCGFSKNGLPIGMQIIGQRFRECDVLALAHAFEAATAWHTRAPVL
jgi:aspartyl-tRNA(Asn)/glutamyl-tRNA(Gln) amidotransferase subunit A